MDATGEVYDATASTTAAVVATTAATNLVSCVEELGIRVENIIYQGLASSLSTLNEDEKKLIKTMKKASRLMIVGNSSKGNQTTDHYSMMGFTKAYDSAKKSCA